jgi:uncharacterized protein (DUF58 family)
LLLVCFLMAWNRGIALLYGVVALTLAAILLSHVLTALNLRGLRIVRETIPAVSAGDKPILRYRLGAPGKRHFLLIDEPRLARITPTMVGQFDRSARVERELHELTRGVYSLDDVRVSTTYPFGLLTAERLFPQRHQELIVYPRWHDVAPLPSPQSYARSAMTEVVASRQRGWDEFVGVREQRPGESVKHMHWRATARHNRLMVKEYETLTTPGMLIVLPQQPSFETGTAPHSCFEYAIELAVSLARAATHTGYPVHCLSDGASLRRFDLAAHSVELAPALEWFARLHAEGTTQLSLAVERALAMVKTTGWLVTFRHGEDALPGTGRIANHLDFVFDAKSFSTIETPNEGRAPQRLANGVRYFVSRHTTLAAILS